ncbi:hypothetical protein [Maricaulis salignorans]|uniref:hypothetical protein n=1 Tax=Maricaulis salignorans TaxID=144026 RepID=UPI003A8E07F3
MTLAPQKYGSPVSLVLMGSLVIAVMVIATAGEFELIGREWAKRGVGAALALLLLVLGNYWPKLFIPVDARRANPGPVLAAERFAATILVIAGLAALAVWVWWPATQMMAVAGAIVLAGFGLTAANWARVILTGGAAAQSAASGLLASQPRLTVLMLMHALFWVAVIFFADSVWGDAVSRWLTVPFLLLNGGLGLLYSRRLNRQRPAK